MIEGQAGICEQLRAVADDLDLNRRQWSPSEVRAFAAAMEAHHIEAVTTPVGEVAAWMSEAVMTIAVTAAARAAYAEQVGSAAKDADPATVFPEWDQLPPMMKYSMRSVVASGVFAAFGAVPDFRRSAWLDGFATGVEEGIDPEPAETLCPYPDRDVI